MQKIYTAILLLTLILMILPVNIQSQDGIEYGENFIVFEAEATSSPLDKWKLRTPGDPEYLKYETSGSMDPVFNTYIDFTGAFGSADSPLEYRFTCPKTGNYRMVMRMHSPLRNNEAPDKRNDVFVRLEGNYTSATSKPKSELEKNHKFYGRAANKWGACHTLEIGSHAPAIYGLIEGEEYTFTMSGRSPGTSIDYIVFFENVPGLTISGKDLALQLPEDHRPGAIEPTAIRIIPDTITIREGTSRQLHTELEPVTARKELDWSSSDSQIISVDGNGRITAMGSVGQKAVIRASSPVNDTSATCEVSIVEWFPVPIQSISISPVEDTLATGITLALDARIFPTEPDDPALIWTSSDTLVAEVDSHGVVTTLDPGQVTIRATSLAVDSIYDERSFQVIRIIEPRVEFDDDNSYLGSTFKSGDSMVVTINYHAGTYHSVREAVTIMFREMTPDWKVEQDFFVAELDSSVGTKTGSATVNIPLEGVKPSDQLPQGNFYFLFATFSYADNKTVNKGLHPIRIASAFPIESISISPETDTVYVDSTVSLGAVLSPENTDEPMLIWTSSNGSIASVDQEGIVSGHLPGRVTIGATAQADNTVFGLAVIEVIEREEAHISSSENHLSLPANEIRVFPNPIHDGYIRIYGPAPGSYLLKVYNMLGSELFNTRLTIENMHSGIEDMHSGIEDMHSGFLDLGEIGKGVYLLVLRGSSGEISSKVIVIE